MRVYILVGLMIALYLLPWVVNPAASLTTNAYDLAEWASIHPTVRSESPPLMTSLLLRLPLPCLALLIAFTARRSMVSILIVLAITAALLPPLEFIRATDDPNYRQQAALAVITLIGSVIGLSGRLTHVRRWIAAGVALVGAASGVIGLIQGYSLMTGFDLSTQVGLGGLALAAALVIFAGLATINQTG